MQKTDHESGGQEMTVTEVLRNAVTDSDDTRYRIAKATGIDQHTMARFVDAIGSPNGKTIDALADYFGFELVRKNQGKNRKQTGGKKQRSTNK